MARKKVTQTTTYTNASNPATRIPVAATSQRKTPTPPPMRRRPPKRRPA